MMEALLKRGEDLARAAQQAKLVDVSERLKTLLGDAAVAVEGSQVVIRGGGLVKRWLVDPTMRFLAGALK